MYQKDLGTPHQVIYISATKCRYKSTRLIAGLLCLFYTSANRVLFTCLDDTDHSKDDLGLLSNLAADNQSTDDSSNTYSSTNERDFFVGGNDLLERPMSNPFEGGKVAEDEEDAELKHLFQGNIQGM